MRLFLATVLIVSILPYSPLPAQSGTVHPAAPTLDEGWRPLLTEDLKDHWQIFMGVPHASVEGVGADPDSDGKQGTPLGLDRDPKRVFTLQTNGEEPVLRISGEIYAGLTSRDTFENYHLRMQFKWGEHKWPPRLDRLRDSGILYHCTGAPGAFWNVWMRAQEFQVQEGDMGDYYALAGVQAEIPTQKGADSNLVYTPDGKRHLISSLTRDVPSFLKKNGDNETPHGLWNTLELICLGDSSLHIVNGKVVMALYRGARGDGPGGATVPLTKGVLQLQSEGAEAYYKRIEIRSITRIPAEWVNQL